MAADFPLSDSESSSESLYDSEDQIGDLDCRTSLESDDESVTEERGRARLTGRCSAGKVSKGHTNKTDASYQKRKCPSVQRDLNKRFCEEGRHFPFLESTPHNTAVSVTADKRPLGEEVKSALKDITSLLNTVVERVERVENELQ